jgi:ABC-type thiamin/hydroxymethylpyrimidine transport system permease subunit
VNQRPPKAFFGKIGLQDAIYLGFCATFIVITRAVLRLHLKIPGHSMFFMMFFLMLGRACIQRHGAATLTGLVAGIISMLLGMGKGGPLIILRFLLPGVMVDVAFALFPLIPTSYVACIVAGAIASSVRFFPSVLVDWLMGMEKAIVLQHALIGSVMGMLFGGLGSAMIPPIVRRLKSHGLIR